MIPFPDRIGDFRKDEIEHQQLGSACRGIRNKLLRLTESASANSHFATTLLSTTISVKIAFLPTRRVSDLSDIRRIIRKRPAAFDDLLLHLLYFFQPVLCGRMHHWLDVQQYAFIICQSDIANGLENAIVVNCFH